MSTYSEKKLRDVIDAFNRISDSLDRLETALAAVDVDEYKPAGQDFIRDMAWAHRRMKETHICYQSDVAEAESSLNPKIEITALQPGLEVAGTTGPITDAELLSMADEDGNLIGAE